MKSPEQIVYEVLQPRLQAGFSFEQFAEVLSTFEVIPVEVKGETVGAILRRGDELHAVVEDSARGKWFGRHVLRLIEDTIDKHGKATTKVCNEHALGHWFAKRLGFIETARDNAITHYQKVTP